MKIALVSGFLNDHLLPLCEELNKKGEFNFIATQNLSGMQAQFKNVIHKDYVLRYYDSSEKQKAVSSVIDSDAVIFGGSSGELLELRKKSNKLSFIYTERFFKKGSWRRFIPATRKLLNKQFLENSDNLYVLCSGSFVAQDLKLIGFDTDRCFKFGYFPKVEPIVLEDSILKKNNKKPKLLYVGRLIRLKRVKDILKCCKRLKSEGTDFELNIVGDGPERKSLEKMCDKYNLDTVHFLGAKPSNEVFSLMAQSNVMYMTSNYLEGWGAVVNEALYNACPVIVSNACGSASYLIKNGENGHIYKMGNVKDLFDKTKLILQKGKTEDIYQSAHNTIKDEWNAKVAAHRFTMIVKAILENKDTNLYKDGPLSKS